MVSSNHGEDGGTAELTATLEDVHAWLAAAADIHPAWRQRQQLRDTFTDPLAHALASADNPALHDYVYRLFHDEYFAFEPRPNNDEQGDEQQGFVESEAFISIAMGGNGSGKTYCGAQKTVRFLESTPPPAANTPFWIIANSYDQVCSSCWFQKLRTIIPNEWIDWKKITWLSEKRGWPKAVPLKAWPGRPGKNWVLEFKSYEQGREEMQAAAIGGAWFTEQFPWPIFEEVLRGCREYGFPGSIFAEFTPIDPAKSVEMEDAYNNWLDGQEQYKNWAFFRLNTETALKAGHVDANWYQAFFSAVSEEMKETRLKGVFASYEGAIYQSFRPSVHLIDDGGGSSNDFPPGVIHKRGVDWGAGQENAFCLLWAYRDTLGAWYFYDEYYTNDQQMTWEDHLTAIHLKDGWEMVRQGNAYKLEPREGHFQRWNYSDTSHFAQTYAPMDRPDMFRTFGQYVLPVVPAKMSVDSGIETVRNCMKINPVIDEPMLFIDRYKCPNLARQIRTYRWERSSGQGVNPRDAAPRPLKKDDHAPDACRYLLHTDHIATMAGPEGRKIIRPSRAGIRHKRVELRSQQREPERGSSGGPKRIG